MHSRAPSIASSCFSRENSTVVAKEQVPKRHPQKTLFPLAKAWKVLQLVNVVLLPRRLDFRRDSSKLVSESLDEMMLKKLVKSCADGVQSRLDVGFLR